MSDLIRRSDAIEAIEMVTWYHQNRNKDMVSGANSDEHQAWYKAQDIYEALEAVPSADRPQGWIPCSERLPNDDELMLVTYVDPRPEAMDIWIGWHEMENVWYIDGEAHSNEFGNEVIAWMPLPPTYEGKGADDE